MSVDYISNDMRNIIDFIEGRYLIDGDVPTAKAIASAALLSEEQIVEWLKEPMLIDALQRRGIVASSNGLTPEMLACANVLLDFSDKRSKTAKLASLGLTTQQYQAFVKNRAFNAYVTTRAEQLLPDSMHEAHTALLKNVERGETQSLKLFYEITGRHNPAQQQSLNVEQILTQIFDIITLRVKDPATLQEISRDLAALSAGVQPRQQGTVIESNALTSFSL